MSFADLLVLLAVALLAAWAILRYTPSDSQDWHVDPLTVRKPHRPNHVLLRQDGPFIALPPDQVAARLDALTRQTPGTEAFAGEGFHRTWITRAGVLKLPTFTSIRLIPEDGGTRVTIYARARYFPDLPQRERDRVGAWIAALTALVPRNAAEPPPMPTPDH